MKITKNNPHPKKTVYPRLGVYSDEDGLRNGAYYIQFREDTDWYSLSGKYISFNPKYLFIKPLSEGEQITLTQE